MDDEYEDTETQFSVQLDTLLDRGLLPVILELEDFMQSDISFQGLSQVQLLARVRLHMNQFSSGHETDENTGQSHVVAAIANALYIRAKQLEEK
jgi:hypothetical protein